MAQTATPLLTGYRPDGSVLAAFLAGTGFARALVGPRSGGRKIAAVADIAGQALRAAPARWRVAVAAARAEDLQGGAMRAVAEAFGPDAGKWDLPGRRFAIDIARPDGRRAIEFHFFGLDRPEQRRQWDAAAATIVWLCGARDLGLDALDRAVELAGSWSEGADRALLIATSRMPEPGHWLALRFEAAGSTDADNWTLYRQPGGRSPAAENRTHLDRAKPGFYDRLAARLPIAEIASEVDAEWREAGWNEAQALDPARLALAALWRLKGGFPPAEHRAQGQAVARQAVAA